MTDERLEYIRDRVRESRAACEDNVDEMEELLAEVDRLRAANEAGAMAIFHADLEQHAGDLHHRAAMADALAMLGPPASWPELVEAVRWVVSRLEPQPPGPFLAGIIAKLKPDESP